MAVTKWRTKWRSRVRKTYGFTPDKWDREKFLRDCIIEDGCWVWRGLQKFSVGHRRYDPIDMAYVMMVHSLNDGESAMSICGNKKCCNPKHLMKLVPVKQRKQPSERHGNFQNSMTD